MSAAELHMNRAHLGKAEEVLKKYGGSPLPSSSS